MKFEWGYALYHALRWAFYGAFLALFVSLIVLISGGKPKVGEGIIGLFWLFGLARLGKEVFTKKYTDA